MTTLHEHETDTVAHLTHDGFHHLGCGLKRFTIVRDKLVGQTSSSTGPLKAVDEGLSGHIRYDIQMYGSGSTTGVEINPLSYLW